VGEGRKIGDWKRKTGICMGEGKKTRACSREVGHGGRREQLCGGGRRKEAGGRGGGGGGQVYVRVKKYGRERKEGTEV
jgi:hypothetical protein